MFNVSLCICLSVEGDALDIAVLVAVAFGGYRECASFDCDFGLVENRTAEPISVGAWLDLIESQCRKNSK